MYWMVIVPVLFLVEVNAQNDELNLLHSLESTSPSKRDSLYYELFKINMFTDASKAKQYALKAVELADEHGNWVVLAKACRALAYAHKSQGQTDSVWYYLRYGISVAQMYKNELTLIRLLIDLGNQHINLDLYDSALSNYNNALEIATRLDDKEGLSTTKHNIGLVFYFLNLYDEALVHFESSLSIRRQNGLIDDIPDNLVNVAILYNELGRYDDAISSLNEVAMFCKNACSDKIEANLNFGLGFSHLKKSDFDEALPYFLRSYEISKRGGVKLTHAYSLVYLSEFRLRSGDYHGAIELLKEAEKISKEINVKRLKRDIYEFYSKAYSNLENSEKIIEYQIKFFKLKDSIVNEQVAFNISRTQLDAQKKQSDLIIQQKETQLSRSRWIIAFVTVVALLLVVIAFLLFNRYRLNRRLKQILQRQVQLRTGDLIQNNEELRQLNLEFEKLLSQTSRYIHGPMTTLIGLINLAEKDQSDPERTQKYLAKIKRVAGEMGLSLEQLKQVGKVKEQKQVEDSTLTLEELLKNDV